MSARLVGGVADASASRGGRPSSPHLSWRWTAFLAILLVTVVPLLGGVAGSLPGGPVARSVAAGPAPLAFWMPSNGPVPRFVPPVLASPSVSSGSNVYYVGAQAPTSVCNPTCIYLTNAGAQTTIQVISTQVTGCLSYWIGDDSAANLWGQVGYYICNGATPLAFYQIWNLNSGAVLTTGTTSVSTGYHTFSMYSVSGGATWAYALDGTVFGTYNMGASLSLGTFPVQAVSEEGLVDGPWTPPQVTFSTAIQTYLTAATFPTGNGWTAAASAFEPWGGCTNTGIANNSGGYSCWGISGNLQDGTIQANALVTGGNRALLRAGASLWTGGTPDFTLTANPSTVAVNAGATGTSTITVASLSGFTGTVSLADTISPSAGLSCTLTPSSVASGSGTSTLSCSGSAGTYTVTVTGSSGPLTHTTSVSFNVNGGTTLTFSFTVQGGGSGYSAPTLTYVRNGVTSTVSLSGTATAFTVDTNSAWSVTNPLAGSSSTERWQTAHASSGTASASLTVVFTYFHQVAITLAYTVLGGGNGYSSPTVSYVSFGAAASSGTGGSAWGDMGATYTFPAALPGSTATEAWRTNNPSGTISSATTISRGYYHQFSATFSYAISGGAGASGAPSVAYMGLGSSLATTAGTTVWVDALSSYAYPAALPGGSSVERWVTPITGGTVTASGTVTPTYLHQFWVDFTFTVKGGSSGLSAPSVTYSNLSASWTVSATTVWVWADAGTAYGYQNPLPGSTATSSWQTNNGVGTIGASATLTASYRHQYKVKFTATTLSGAPTPESPLVNVTEFGANVTLAADSVAWADDGGTYSFPGIFYGPLPGERWVTSTPPSGLVLGPMNITATYDHEFFLSIQVNAPQGGTITGSAGWYAQGAGMMLRASAAPGWQFQGWIGSGTGSYSGSTEAAPVAMNAPVTETAVFYVGITLSASDGGSLQYSFGGTTGWVPAGSMEVLFLAPAMNLTIRAEPSLFHQLDGWSGSASGTATDVVLVPHAPLTVSASFGLSWYSKLDSVLGVALLATATLILALSVRRHRRKIRARADRQARLRARTRA